MLATVATLAARARALTASVSSSPSAATKLFTARARVHLSSSPLFSPPAALEAAATRIIDEHAALVTPDRVVRCDGSAREWAELTSLLARTGGLHKLAGPDAWLARSPPSDVARVEARTFICSARKSDAGLLNNWLDPADARARLLSLFRGSATGRTLFAVPMLYGPPGAAGTKLALQLTDSPYVVLNSHIMAKVAPLAELAASSPGAGALIPLYHSVGAPLAPGDADVPWPCKPDEIAIAHFPESRTVYSFGSGYGGNALLGKKCLSLRLGSVLGRDEGWYAEHMAVIGVEGPTGEKRYVAASFPSSCGKTAFATMTPTLPGWKVTLVGAFNAHHAAPARCARNCNPLTRNPTCAPRP
jgi:phosphoenolpyruvate carboxykinase (GTP)